MNKDPNIGRIIDTRYEILQLIGEGGMSRVYKAKCHLLGRFVAIKILKEEFARDPEVKANFHNESQAVAMLSHPNIIQVFDVSRDPALEYIVMELIDGTTLKDYMHKFKQKNGEPLGWRNTPFFFAQILKALEHAHKKGVIHSDIKPQNIMILRNGTIKVADFGIAKIAHRNDQEVSTLGSVYYISPEQAKGSKVDARSDLYSAGIVLYEMITGRLPFEGDTAISVVMQHINAQPLSPRDIDSQIPEAIEYITMKAISRTLSRRYSSATEMLRDLERFQENPAVQFTALKKEPIFLTPEPEPEVVSVELTKKEIRKEKIRAKAKDPREKDYRTLKTNNSIALLMTVFFVMVAISVLGYFIYAMASDLFAPGNLKKIPVPDLRGQFYSDALADQYEDSFELVPQLEFNNNIEKGYIVSQEPKAGGEAVEKSALKLVVSAGKETLTMPDFSLKSEREVAIQIQQLGLRFKTTDYIEDDNVPQGFVIKTEPYAGVTVEKGQEITIIASMGPKAKDIVMPKIVGLNIQEARAIIANEKLNIVQENSLHCSAPVGQVIDQSIAEGVTVKQFSDIIITVSSGPAETAPPTTETEPETTAPEDTTPEDTTPEDTTQTTTKASNKEITVETQISVPQDIEGEIIMKIELDNQELMVETIPPGKRTVTRTLIGFSSDQVNIYFNDNLHYSKTLGELQAENE